MKILILLIVIISTEETTPELPECFTEKSKINHELLKNPKYINYLKKIIFDPESNKLNWTFISKVFRVLWGDGFAVIKIMWNYQDEINPFYNEVKLYYDN